MLFNSFYYYRFLEIFVVYMAASLFSIDKLDSLCHRMQHSFRKITAKRVMRILHFVQHYGSM